MGILRVDHPDVLEFISCKEDNRELSNFNISIAVTEAFMKAVEQGGDIPLINPHTQKVVRTVSSRMIFDAIVETAWKTGDPGVLFLDRINRDNPTPHLGEMESTNPCGEQPLLPYEPCNLGSINLARMVRESGGAFAIDWERLERSVGVAVRFLDDVIDMSRYLLDQIDRMAKGNRKIGLGVMGFADLLIRLGIHYNSDEALRIGEEIMKLIQEKGREASMSLALERGVFLNYPGSRYDRAGGPRLRNATVTTVAPTGTLSIIAGCSSGIEPLFAMSFSRRVLGDVVLPEVYDYFIAVAKKRGFFSDHLLMRVTAGESIQNMPEIPDDLKRTFVTAFDISPDWHVRMQAAFQRYTDNAVSKTINFPPQATREEVRKAFLLAYQEGVKGITIFRSGSKSEQVLFPQQRDVAATGPDPSGYWRGSTCADPLYC